MSSSSADSQLSLFPQTRYMGSKRKLVDWIWEAASGLEFDSVIDLFSGTGIVGYMFKCHGKRVVSCDFMHMNYLYAKAMVENNRVTVSDDMARALLEDHGTDGFVEDTFGGLYYTDADDHLIDVLRANIAEVKDPYEHAIALSALMRACTKKRPRGIFTYVGHRYDDGRQDLRLGMDEQFLKAVGDINAAVFSNGRHNRACCGDSLGLRANAQLVYIDPPYFNPHSDNDYVRRYHFLEGLARDWQGVEIDQRTKTKKFKSYRSQFSTRDGAYDAFDYLFRKYRNHPVIVSYSSNSLPTKDEMLEIMGRYKSDIDVIPIDYRYSFATRPTNTHNQVKEYLFVGR